jgi:hypothetical protein
LLLLRVAINLVSIEAKGSFVEALLDPLQEKVEAGTLILI